MAQQGISMEPLWPVLAAAYASGKTSTQVAREFRCSYATVLSACRRTGVPVRPTGGPEGAQTGERNKAVKHVDPAIHERWAQVARMRADGKSLTEVAAACGVSRTRIQQIERKLKNRTP